MNAEPLRPVTDAEIAAFQADGAVRLKGMIDPDWVALVRRGVQACIDRPGPLHTVQTNEGEPGFFLSDICMAQQVPEFREFALNSPAPGIAARLMRSKRVNFFADTLWVKSAGTSKRTRWHQDQPFYWIDGSQVCVIWWPLDAIPKEESIEVVKGSHRWGRMFAPELSKHGKDLYGGATGTAFERMPDIDAARDRDYEILSWSVEPGDCVCFWGVSIHGAPGSTGGRRALSTIWMGDDTTYGPRPSRGRPHFEGHDLQPGEPMDSDYFPRVWPREAPINAEALRRFSDRGLVITHK